MFRLLPNLRNVPDDEADDVRAILDAKRIAYGMQADIGARQRRQAVLAVQADQLGRNACAGAQGNAEPGGDACPQALQAGRDEGRPPGHAGPVQRIGAGFAKEARWVVKRQVDDLALSQPNVTLDGIALCFAQSENTRIRQAVTFAGDGQWTLCGVC